MSDPIIEEMELPYGHFALASSANYYHSRCIQFYNKYPDFDPLVPMEYKGNIINNPYTYFGYDAINGYLIVRAIQRDDVEMVEQLKAGLDKIRYGKEMFEYSIAYKKQKEVDAQRKASAMTLEDLKKILYNVTYKTWHVNAKQINDNNVEDGFVIWVHLNNPPIRSYVTGRKWFIEYTATENDVVRTSFAAIRMAEEHEMMRNFRYRGVLTANPNMPIDAFVKDALENDEHLSHDEISRRRGEANAEQ